MSELDQEAWNEALQYENHGETIVNAAYNMIVEHKRHIGISATTAAINVWLQHEPQSVEEFMKHYPGSVVHTSHHAKMLNRVYDHFEQIFKRP